MVVNDILRGLVIVCLVLLLIGGYITPWILLLFTLIISTVEAFRIPASMAAIPLLLVERYYEYGTGLNSSISTVVQLIGLGAAGAIIGIFGIHVAIFIDAVTFFGSALILSFLHITEAQKEKIKIASGAYFQTLKEGFLYLKNQPIIRNFCFMGIIINAIIVPLNALQTPLVVEVFQQGTEMLSVLGIVLTIGMGIGSFVYPMIQGKFKTKTFIVITGTMVGFSMFGYTVAGRYSEMIIVLYSIVMVCSFLLGLSTSIMLSVVSVQFMKAVQPEYLARVGSIFNASATAAVPVTSLLVGMIASIFTVTQIFIVSAILCVLLFIYIGVFKVRLE